MTVRFSNVYLRKLYEGEPTGKPKYNDEVVQKFKEKVKLLELIDSTKTLRLYKSLHFESLRGDKKGFHSIRINKQYQLEFEIENDVITKLEIVLITELSKHYE